MPLNELAIKHKKPAEKPFKLTDEKGLFLLIHPNGSKYWRFKYRIAGKEKLLAFGVYPDVSLAEARNRRDKARTLLANGVDPGVVRQASKQAARAATENSFESIAREWLAKQSSRWVPRQAERMMRRLELHVFPWLGVRPVAEITPSELLTVLRRIEQLGKLETAHRVYQYSGQIFRYAIATNRTERDPSAILRGALPPIRAKHLAAITEPKKVGELIRSIRGYEGSFITKSALLLAPLVFVRGGELRHAEWSEINLELADWTIPAQKMKMRQPHLVPLAKQAVNILEELHPLTGQGRYVFPCARTSTRPMSENTINAALRRLGYSKDDVTAHGFRATARTILDEVLGFRPDVIEHQLAHAVKDPLGRAYNRTSHLQVRREMMQRWADFLDELASNH